MQGSQCADKLSMQSMAMDVATVTAQSALKPSWPWVMNALQVDSKGTARIAMPLCQRTVLMWVSDVCDGDAYPRCSPGMALIAWQLTCALCPTVAARRRFEGGLCRQKCNKRYKNVQRTSPGLTHEQFIELERRVHANGLQTKQPTERPGRTNTARSGTHQILRR